MDAYMDTVTVQDVNPVADFVWEGAKALEGTVLPFIDLSTDIPDDQITAWEWDFGDGGSSTDQSPDHVYAEDGLYTVTLRVTDEDSSSQVSKDVTIGNIAPIWDTRATHVDSPVDEGSPANLVGIFKEPGSLDTHTASVDWGDGDVDTYDSGDVIYGPGGGQITGSHAYGDDGVYTVTLTVTDDEGESDVCWLTVTVLNVAPVVDLGPDRSVDEGDLVELHGAYSDPGWLDTHSLTWDYGDGTSMADPTGTVLDTSCTYMDDGVYTVTLTVTDDDGGVGSDTLVVTVNDLSPTADFEWAPEPQFEGVPDSFFDVSTSYPDEIVGWSWDFGDGGFSTDQNPVYTYFDNGVYSVTLTVTDDDGSTDVVMYHVTVLNVPPTADAGEAQTAHEGDTVIFDGGFTDPGTDTHTYEWDFGDGGSDSGTLTPTHAYGDNGVYTVTLTVTDDDGGFDTDTTVVTVLNVAPSVDAGPDQTVDEGDTVTFSGSFYDPGWLDTHTYEWDFGDGTSTTGTLTPTHAYADNGVYTVTLTVADDDGGFNADTMVVTVLNVAPSADAGPDQTVNEGDEVSLSGGFIDPGTADTHTYEWDFGDGRSDSGTLTPTHAYGDDGAYTVTLTVTDDDGGWDTASLTVTVINVAPTVDAGLEMEVTVGETVDLLCPFTDPGWLDTHTATIDWEDGTVDAGAVSEADGSGTVAGSHVYDHVENFTVTVTVLDDDGGVGSDTVIIRVNRIPVPIDIKPGSFPNSINLKKNGVTPVAILNDESWSPYVDPANVDPSTVTFGPDGASPVHWALCDVDGDGDVDLILHFEQQETGMQEGDESAILQGKTYDGKGIIGEDSVRILATKNLYKHQEKNK